MHDYKEILKEKLILILNEIDRICKILNIKYYLICGSCLGAVRHEGIIPWDDDIDIGLMRKDYEVFINNCMSLIDDRFLIQNNKTDSNYFYCYSKVRYKDSIYKESYSKKIIIHKGIFIDVFVIDEMSNNKIIRNIDYLIIKMGTQLLYAKNIPNVKFNNFFSFILKLILSPFSNKILINFIDNISKRHSKKKSNKIYCVNYYGAWGRREIVKKSYFGEGTIKKFENMELVIPANYDKYLKTLYGDYMVLPTVEKRKSDHSIVQVVIDGKEFEINEY